ncbi:MAG: M14 family metallopeptidase [Alphaproteobacteria bacterium]
MSDAYPVELTAPDISAYRNGNTGLDYVTTFDSGKPGPHVMVAAVTHGNELCGAITLDFLFRQEIRPKQGKLTFAFNNYRAFLSFNPAQPLLSRFVDEDFNRLWSPEVLDGPRSSAELERARELRPFVDGVDFLLDIHSMQTSVAPLMLAGPLLKGRELAGALGVPVYVVSDEGHAAGRRLRDYGDFGDPSSKKNALLVECGQHWEKASADVSLQTALRFLLACDSVEPQSVEAHLTPVEGAQKFVEVTDVVTIKTNAFTFVEPYRGLEVIPEAGTLLGRDGGEDVRTPHDNCILIMPSRRLFPGQTAVRLGRFLET